MMRILALTTICLLSLVCRANSLAAPTRSVRRCDTFSGPAEQCKLYCWQTYVTSNGDNVIASKNVFYSELVSNFIVEEKGPAQQNQQCCCYYEAAWPKELMRLEFINRKSSEMGKIASRTECLPIIVSLNLTRRTKNVYNDLCRLLNDIKRPLTMLELAKFIDDADYLNYMKPKHPSIWKTLKAKEVSKIDSEAAEEFRAIYKDKLLDHEKPLDQYEGAQLGSRQLREFKAVKNLMSKALKSRVVAVAFDELVISHSLVDVAAAANHIRHMNYQELGLPDHIIEGDYDKYDNTSRSFYFSLEGLDCKLLGQIHSRLTTYLSVLRSLLSGLFQKGVFEVMSEKYPNLIELQTSERIYKTLMEVNCQINKG